MCDSTMLSVSSCRQSVFMWVWGEGEETETDRLSMSCFIGRITWWWFQTLHDRVGEHPREAKMYLRKRHLEIITICINRGHLGSDIRIHYTLWKRAQVGVEVQQCEFFLIYIGKEKAWVTDHSTLDTSIDFDVFHVISDNRLEEPKFECH